MNHARNTDPDTSHDAIPDNLSAQALRVLAGYRFGDAILDHIAYARVGMDTHLARLAHQRCSDLRRAGYIERIGQRAPTPSGKFGHLCQITAAGREYLARNTPGEI